MATFFIDYQKMVLQAYEQKKVNNTLPHGLEHLTPAKLKKECLMRCRRGLNKRDEKVIRDFCEEKNESRACQVIVEQCDTDKFKPLVNFLRGGSGSTDAKNIELLAWLIDFPGRPWERGKTYSIDGHSIAGTASQESDDASPAADDSPIAENIPPSMPATEYDKPIGTQTIPENPPIPEGIDDLGAKGIANPKGLKISSQEKLKGKSAKRLAVVVMLSLVLSAGGIWWWKDNNRSPDLSGGCMYWMEDHYEPIACNQKIPGVMIIALDTVKLKNFKRITAPDTINYLSIGKVWYSKIDGKIEYYTSGGEHPVVFDHRLKPITKYIIDKYILSGMVTK